MAAPPITTNTNTDQQHNQHHHNSNNQQQQTTDTPQHNYYYCQNYLQRQYGDGSGPMFATAAGDHGTQFQAAPLLFVPPSTKSSSTNGAHIEAVSPPQQKQPEFVVFELFGQQKQRQQQQNNHQQLLNVQQKFPNKWAPFSPLLSLKSRTETAAPTLNTEPQHHHHDQLKHNAEEEPSAEATLASASSTASNGICFATVHLWHDTPSSVNKSNANNNNSSSNTTVSKHRTLLHEQRTTSRLLFDNPMFRRLPNWHFFGDDRRLMPIPPLIPLLPVMPIERTLLYIAPNESSSRQLLLLAMLDMKRKTEIMGGVPAIGGDNNTSPMAEEAETSVETGQLLLQHHEQQQQDDELLPMEPECRSSTSGVESMSSAEESSAMTERSSRSTTPTNKGGRSTPEEQAEASHHHHQQDNLHHHYDDGDERNDNGGQQEEDVLSRVDQQQLQHSHRRNSPTSSATESCTSSTPNSPPTFDRRIVRMSRGTRDAVRRLSRRFEEEREEEEEEEEEEGEESSIYAVEEDIIDENEFALPQSPSSPVASLAPTTVLMMSTAGQTPVHRSRHCSAGSNSAQPNNNHTNKRSSINSDEAISRMDVLSERIRDFHYNEDQTHAQLNRKLQLRDQLYYAISPIFPMCGLYIVGSSLNGFGTKRSDLDLCLMITNRDIDQRTDAVVVLSSVMRTLESNQIVAEQNLILAKVPILRIKFVGTFHDITVDLNVNNSVAIRNTHLMCYYSSFDWRVRPLVMVVKEWAKRRGINDSACSSFTSYSLVLMVIHYLQCGAEPPVLPNLQQMYPKRFNVRADVRTLNVSLPFEPIPTAMGWQFKDDATLSELLLGFLRYYAFQFDFDADAISIRMGKKVNRAQVAQNQSPFNTLSQWHCICIEEPFTLSNAAHSVYDERIFQDIKKAFVDSYRELDKHRDLDRFLGPPVEPSTSSATAPKN